MTDTIAVVSDHQIPFHDKASIAATNKYLKALKPDGVIINGDFMDFPALSLKFKRARADKGQIAEELEEGKQQLRDLRAAVGKNSDIWFLEGNHDMRWRTYIEERADELGPLVDDWLTLTTALELDKLNIEFRTGWDTGSAIWERDGLVVTHGSWHSKTSAAKNHRDHYGSALFAHIHRPTLDAKTTHDGRVQIARSTGALCNIHGDKLPPRASNTPSTDSVQGFAVIHFGATRYQVHLLDIVNNTVTGLDGKEYTA